MELLEYLAILRKRWVTVIATLLVVVAGSVGITLTSTPEYQSTTRLFFAVPRGETVSDLAQGSSFTEKQMSSYAQVATSPLVLESVIADLGLETTAEQLSASIRPTVPADTVILEVAATSTEPSEAAAIANAVGSRLSEVVSDLYPERADGTQAVLATTLSPATPPGEPSAPNPRRNLALGLFIGLGLGTGLALLLQMLDTRIRSVRDLEALTDRAVLGSVVFDPEADSRPISMIDEPNGVRAEMIRRVRTNLQFVDLAKGPRSILITSSLASEGKTTTAANLAVALADAGSRVLLVDADLRRPSLARMLGLESGAGLTTVLIGRARAEEVIQPWHGGRIDVLASGPVPPNPSELLGSVAMVDALASLKERYDVVLLDSPPLLPVTDGAVLSGRVDGTIVVVAAGRTHKVQLLSALDALDAVDSHVLGVVLNKIEPGKGDAYGAGYSYAHPHGARSERSGREQSAQSMLSDVQSDRPPRTVASGRRRLEAGDGSATTALRAKGIEIE